MATFSTNQVRQIYVANALGSVYQGVTPGTIEVKADSGKTNLYFKYMGAGGQTRSDLITISNIISANATDADSLKRPLKKYKLTLDSNVNGGNPVGGQDYLVRIAFRNYVGMSDEDQYFKYGVARAVKNMTAATLYNILLESLKKNFSRETSKLLSFTMDGVKATATMDANSGVTLTAKEAGTDGNNIKFAIASVTASTAGIAISNTAGAKTIAVSLTAAAKTIGDLKTLIAADPRTRDLIVVTGTDATALVAETTAVALTGGTSTGILIEELPQEWILGKLSQTPVYFTVQPSTILFNSEEVIWGEVAEQSAANYVENGKLTADLEYFLAGEKGDIYRAINFPHNINTTYLVDPAKQYNFIDIHFAYVGNNESVQKSERTLTIVIPKVGATNNVSNALANSIISAINTAAGTTIATLSVA